jgi:hypothetical protein
MTDKIKQSKCACNCFEEKAVDPSRRDFIRKASTLTLIGSTAFIPRKLAAEDRLQLALMIIMVILEVVTITAVEIMAAVITAVEIMAAEQEILAIIMIHQLVLLLLISL